MKRSGLKAVAFALRIWLRTRAAWVALLMAMLFAASPSAAAVVVNPTSLPAASVGAAYSQTITGSGGTAPYGNFIVTAGALPAGLSLDSASGALTGTPTAGGSFNVTISTTDSAVAPGPQSGSRAYTLTVDAPTITLSSTSGSFTAGEFTNRIFTASGGTAPYSFAVTSGPLPAGLSLAADGRLTGAPVDVGLSSVTITATDSSTGAGAPYAGARSYPFVVSIPQPPSILPVIVFVPHNSTEFPIPLNYNGGAIIGGIFIPGAGGTPTSVAVPSPPSHGTLHFDGLWPTYTPTPGYAGPDSFTYRASNFAGTSNTATVSIGVETPTITIDPTSLPDGGTGLAYSQTVTATGGSGPYSYAVTSGTPPTGLTLSAAGVLSGTPSVAGPYSFAVTATDAAGNGPLAPFTGAQPYTVTIVIPTPAIAGPVSATVDYDSSSNPIALNITGGAPTTVAVSSAATNGTAAAAGTSITYTPAPGYSGPDSFAYTATNSEGTSAPATVSITVRQQPPVANLAWATVAQDSSNNPITLNITGGIPTSVDSPGAFNGSWSSSGPASASPRRPASTEPPPSSTRRRTRAGLRTRRP